MEKLIKKYKEECEIYSKTISILWKLGQIIYAIITILLYLNGFNYIFIFGITIIGGITLYYICEVLECIKISKKINLKYSYKEIVLKKNIRNNTYKEFNRFQKNWITRYCNTNKLNNIEKLKIIREELSKKDTNIKYIDPAVIGGLSIIIWEIILQYAVENIGIKNSVILFLLLILIMSIVVGCLKKELQEQKEFMDLFDRYSGYKRLQELLLYRSLRVSK